MSKLIHLSLFSVVLGLGTQLVACGGDEEGGADSSPKDVCDAVIKNMKDAGEDIDDGDAEECEKELTEMKKEMGDAWGDFASCAMKAKSEKDMGPCMEKAEKAAKSSASKS